MNSIHKFFRHPER